MTQKKGLNQFLYMLHLVMVLLICTPIHHSGLKWIFSAKKTNFSDTFNSYIFMDFNLVRRRSFVSMELETNNVNEHV